ncbi:MAG: hypothetical protein AB7F75_03120 [Planctomycetota bacterium]
MPFAGMKPPPPPLPSQDRPGDLADAKTSDWMTSNLGSIERLEMPRYKVETVSASDISPCHGIKKGASWGDWQLPAHDAAWRAQVEALLGKALSSEATDEDFKKLGSLGPSTLRVLESWQAPRGRSARSQRERIVAMFPGDHARELLLKDLLGDSKDLADDALELLEADTQIPVLHLALVHARTPDHSQSRERVEKLLKARLGKKESNDILPLLRRLVEPGSTLPKAAEPPEWVRALAIRSQLAALPAMSVRKRLEACQAMLAGIPPEPKEPALQLMILLVKVRSGQKGEIPSMEALLKRVGAAERMLAAETLESFGPGPAEPLIPLLLDLQADLLRMVRTRAQQSLSTLYGCVRPAMDAPDYAADTLDIRSARAWWLQRGLLFQSFGEPVEVKAELAKGQVVPSGESHAVLQGTFKGSRVKVVDHNDNGSFTDFGSDNLWIEDRENRMQFLSRMVEIGGEWYGFDLDEDRMTFTFRRYQGPMGALTITCDYKSLWDMPYVVLSMGRDVTVALYNYKDGFEARKLPVGIYTLYQSMIWIKRPKKMMFRAQVFPGLRRPIIVKDGAVTHATFGGQLKPHVDARFVAPLDVEGDSILGIRSVTLCGEQGEEYTNYSPELKSSNEVRIIKVRLYKDEQSTDTLATWDWRMIASVEVSASGEVVMPQREDNYYIVTTSPDGFNPTGIFLDPLEAVYLDLDMEVPFAKGIQRSRIRIPRVRVSSQPWQQFQEGLSLVKR